MVPVMHATVTGSAAAVRARSSSPLKPHTQALFTQIQRPTYNPWCDLDHEPPSATAVQRPSLRRRSGS
jgi:hypothetical protein